MALSAAWEAMGKTVTDTSDQRQAIINPWTLAFADRELEGEFQASWLRATKLVNRIWVTSGIASYALFTVLLMAYMPPHGPDFIWIRYTIVLPVLLLTQVPVHFGHRFRHMQGLAYLTATLSAFGGTLFLFAYCHPGHNLVYLFELAAIFVYCQHYNRIFFKYTVAFSVIASGGLAATVAIYRMLPDVPAIPVAVSLAGLALVGIFSSHTRELFVRRNYVSMRNMKRELARNKSLAQEAKSGSDAKSRFLAMVSHELRTPLSVIIGNADLIKSGVLGPIGNTKIDNAVEDISQSGNRLLEIVSDVLDLSRASADRIEINETTVDLTSLAAETTKSFATEAVERGIAFNLIDDPDLPNLRADKRLIRRVLANLLSNALKYTNKGGEVWLYVLASPSGGVAMEIKDTGIGFSPAELGNAMELFSQVDGGYDRHDTGMGIGLPLAKHLVELHGGTIEIDSEAGRGTRVRINFPAERSIEPASTDLAGCHAA